MKSIVYLLLSFSLLCLGACKKDSVQSPAATTGETSPSSLTETNFNVQFTGWWCSGISEYTDNGNLAVGITSEKNIQIIKIDKQGNQVWKKIIGAPGFQGLPSIVATSDNAYLIAGYADSLDVNFAASGNSPLGSFVLKIDLLGNMIWVKSFNNSFSPTSINCLIRTIDNNYIVMKSGGLGKIDKDGNIIWSTIFKPSDLAAVYAVKMIQDKNGDFVVAGWTCTLEFWIAKYDQKGICIWEKAYGGSGDDQAFGITVDQDNNYVVIGSGGSNNGDVPLNHGNDAWLLKLNQDGNKIWSKTLGGSNLDNILSIRTLSNGQYLVAGRTRSIDFDLASFNLPSEAVRGWLLKINADGTLDSHQIYQEGELQCIGKGDGDDYLIGGKAATSEEKSFWVLSVPAP